jgi:hypothetical protein
MALNDDGGCEVDWTWLAGQKIRDIRSSLDALTITFESGLTWTVQARLWKGAAFLAFDPWRAQGSP